MKRFTGQYLFAVIVAATGVTAGLMAGVCLGAVLFFSNILPAIPLAIGAVICKECLQMSSYYFIRES